METATKRLLLGKAQEWNGIGVIESTPEKTILNNGKWFMMVNLRTRTKRGVYITVRCMFLDDIASTFEQQFRLNDVVYISGEIDEYRAGIGYDNFQIKNIVNVLDFAFWTDFRGLHEPLSQEKAEFLQHCSDLFDKTALPPTKEEIADYKKLHEERAKQNIERRNKAGIPIKR